MSWLSASKLLLEDTYHPPIYAHLLPHPKLGDTLYHNRLLLVWHKRISSPRSPPQLHKKHKPYFVHAAVYHISWDIHVPKAIPWTQVDAGCTTSKPHLSIIFWWLESWKNYKPWTHLYCTAQTNFGGKPLLAQPYH